MRYDLRNFGEINGVSLDFMSLNCIYFVVVALRLSDRLLYFVNCHIVLSCSVSSLYFFFFNNFSHDTKMYQATFYQRFFWVTLCSSVIYHSKKFFIIND